MKNTFLKTIGTAALSILMLAIFAQISVFAQDDTKQDQNEIQLEGGNFPSLRTGSRDLEGSWSVQASVFNCQTGAVFQNFPKMNTFMQGGTLQESSTGAGFLRASGHGVWSRGRGQRYSYAVQFFRFNPDGTYAGLTRARWEVDLSLTGNSYTAYTVTIQIINPAGVVVNTLCGAETGTRFE